MTARPFSIRMFPFGHSFAHCPQPIQASLTRNALILLRAITGHALFTALLGGSLGALAGMRLFHHKTRHWYFVWGIPLMLALHVLAGLWLWMRFGR